MPALLNIDIFVGNSGVAENPDGIVFDWLDNNGIALDLTGYEFIFRVISGSADTSTELIRKTSSNNEINVVGSRITIPITIAETRLINSAKRYEIESRIDGSERTILYGVLNPIGGANDDS